MDNRITTFLSGPTSGLPADVVRQKFADAARRVRSLGYDPVFPPTDADGQMIGPAFETVMSCRQIFMMDGWRQSDNARKEYRCAVRRRIPVIFETFLDDQQRKKDAAFEKCADAIAAIKSIFDVPFGNMSFACQTARIIFVHYCLNELDVTPSELSIVIQCKSFFDMDRRFERLMNDSKNFRKWEHVFQMAIESIRNGVSP